MGKNEEKKFFWMPVPGLELTTFGSMCTVNISIHNNKKKIHKNSKNKIIAYNVYQSIKQFKFDKYALNECRRSYIYSVIERNGEKMSISDKVQKDVKNASKI